MNYTYSFEKLEIWQLSVDFAAEVYKLTNDFPNEEKFGVISQMRRAANSIGANIVEGNSRFSQKERARFLEIAYGSLMEVLHFLYISRKLEYLDQDSFANIKESIYELSNKINAFKRNLK